MTAGGVTLVSASEKAGVLLKPKSTIKMSAVVTPIPLETPKTADRTRRDLNALSSMPKTVDTGGVSRFVVMGFGSLFHEDNRENRENLVCCWPNLMIIVSIALQNSFVLW